MSAPVGQLYMRVVLGVFWPKIRLASHYVIDTVIKYGIVAVVERIQLMGKRKSKVKSDKVRVELRFDPDVYEKVKTLAERADISINQLMQGVARWAGENGHIGEPHMEERDEVFSLDRPGSVWFGRNVTEYEYDKDGHPWPIPAYIAFSLDFSDRRALQENWKKPIDPETESE